MTVKLYTPIAIDEAFGMECHQEGCYVTYSDYQKLVAERDDFKKSAEYSAATNKRIVAINNRLCDENEELRYATGISDICDMHKEWMAQGVNEYAQAFRENTNMDFACNRGFYHGALDFAANLRAGIKG